MEALPASERLSPKVTIWVTWPGVMVAARAKLQDVARAAMARRLVFGRIFLFSVAAVFERAASIAQNLFDSQARGTVARVFRVFRQHIPSASKCVKVL